MQHVRRSNVRAVDGARSCATLTALEWELFPPPSKQTNSEHTMIYFHPKHSALDQKCNRFLLAPPSLSLPSPLQLHRHARARLPSSKQNAR